MRKSGISLSPFERRRLRFSMDAELRRVGEGLADAAGMLEEVDELSDLLQEQERALQRDSASLVLCGLERQHCDFHSLTSSQVLRATQRDSLQARQESKQKRRLGLLLERNLTPRSRQLNAKVQEEVRAEMLQTLEAVEESALLAEAREQECLAREHAEQECLAQARARREATLAEETQRAAAKEEAQRLLPAELAATAAADTLVVSCVFVSAFVCVSVSNSMSVSVNVLAACDTDTTPHMHTYITCEETSCSSSTTTTTSSSSSTPSSPAQPLAGRGALGRSELSHKRNVDLRLSTIQKSL